MGCDGIFECKTNEGVINYVKEKAIKTSDLETIAKDLLDDILAKDTSCINYIFFLHYQN